MMMKPAIFLDRDGVINHDSPSYIRSWSDFEFKPGVLDALATIASWEVYIFIVTNQSGLARGYFNEATLAHIHLNMLAEITRNSGRIDKIYYCPHHPDSGCFCRKPKVGLFEQAAGEYSIDRKQLYLVGDASSDIVAGKRFGCFSILLDSPTMHHELSLLMANGIGPDARASGLAHACTIILEKIRTGPRPNLAD